MSRWSAGDLHPGYHRCLVGFDVRSSRPICATLVSQPPGCEDSFIATVDNQIWPEQIDASSMALQHGFNLFESPPEEIGIKIDNDAVVVAFDLPESLATTLISTFGLAPIGVEYVAGSSEWELVGYDVVDIRTQCSGFYSFNWTKQELEDALGKLSLTLNCYGLVDEESLAIKASVVFDSMIIEHAPFAPCGVWIKQ